MTDTQTAPDSDINGTPADAGSLAGIAASLKRIETLIAKRPAVATEYLSAREAAQLLGIDYATFKRLVAKKMGPPMVGVTAYGRYHVDALRAWAAAQPVRVYPSKPSPNPKAKKTAG